MRTALRLPLSVEDYLEGEKTSLIKHEYVNGRAYAMTGTSSRHNAVVLGLAFALRARARAKACKVFVADLKVAADDRGCFYYPDVVLSCEQVADDAYIIDHPCLIAEVLSPSTEAIDRREKLHAYQTLPSLREYLLVSADVPAIEVWRRAAQGWIQEWLEAEDSLRVECLEASITVSDIYAG